MDMVYVVDRTNSFVPQTFDRVQEQLTALANSAVLAFNEPGAFRLGLITFIDGVPEEGVELRHELTTDVTSVLATLNSLFASAGNGGCPEASDEALDEAVQESVTPTDCNSSGTFAELYRSGCIKHVVLITDERPGGCNNLYEAWIDRTTAMDITAKAAENGIHLIQEMHHE